MSGLVRNNRGVYPPFLLKYQAFISLVQSLLLTNFKAIDYGVLYAFLGCGKLNE